MLLPSKRALLLGGAAAGAFAGSAQADQAFTAFQFKSLSGSLPGRTMPQRLDDIFNVKDFGAQGNGSANDTAAIQAAVNAAVLASGAIVFFPPGVYNITSSINVDGLSHAGIRIVGSGGSGTSPNSASRLQGSFAPAAGVLGGGYLIRGAYATGQVSYNDPIHSIENLDFYNNFHVTPGSITDVTMCPGGVFLPGGISPYLLGCHFYIHDGCCVFSNAQNMRIQSCNVLQNYVGNKATDHVGFIGQNLTVSDCKIVHSGFGIVAAGGINAAFTSIENIDIELSGTAISIGWQPIGVLINLSPPSAGTISPAGGTMVRAANIRTINTEGCGDLDGSSKGVIFCSNSIYSITISNVYLYCDFAESKTPPYGLRLEGVHNSMFSGIQVDGTGGTAGGVRTAVFSIAGGTSGLRFHGCRGFNSHTAAPIWDISPSFGAGDNGITWEHCDTDGALPLANLPPSPQFGGTMVCSDSTVVASNANLYATITGGGANKVLARWNGANWKIAG